MAVKDKKKAKVAMGSTSATPHIAQEKEKETESSVMVDSSGLLQTLQGHVEEVRALIQCGICVRPLYEPYTLACGHTFCYGCLTSWFSSGRSHKTCPDCRAQVKIQPAPAYLVRAIVQMFTSNAELLEKGETTAEHSKNQREEAEKLEADKTSENPNTGGLFQGCFKPKPHHVGPIYDADDGVTRCPNCAWELEEDECVNCGYHAEDGSIGDSEDFSDMTDEDDEDDDNEDDDEDDEDEEMDDDMTDYDDAWVDNYPHPLPFHVAQQLYDEAHGMIDHHHFHHHHHHPLHNHPFLPPVWLGNGPIGQMDASSMTHTSDNESEEEEDDNSEESSSNSEDDDDEEMESFIDDGSIHYENSQDSEGGYITDRSTVIGDRSDDIHPGTHTESPGSESSGSRNFQWNFSSDNDPEDDEEDDEDEPIRPAPVRRPGQNASYRSNPISRGLSRTASNPTSGFQNRSANGASARTLGLSRSHTHRAPLSQAQGRAAAGTSTNRGGFVNPRNNSIPHSTGAGSSATNAITVDDDSEDEMPVPATRRSRNNRR